MRGKESAAPAKAEEFIAYRIVREGGWYRPYKLLVRGSEVVSSEPYGESSYLGVASDRVKLALEEVAG